MRVQLRAPSARSGHTPRHTRAPSLPRDPLAADSLTQVLQRAQHRGQVPAPPQLAQGQRRPPAEPVLLTGRPAGGAQAAPDGFDFGAVVVLPPRVASPQRLQGTRGDPDITAHEIVPTATSIKNIFSVDLYDVISYFATETTYLVLRRAKLIFL